MHKKISQSYNIQASSSEGYIVAIDIAEGNAENDLKQLVPILSQVERNVGKRTEKASADSGYFHSSSLEYLHKKEIDGFIPSPSEVSGERKGEEDSGYEAHYFNYNRR